MAEKILVIDDHQETINLVSVILKRQGYRLYMARSGKDGIAVAEQEDPDLILLDVMMPDMDGLEVCRRLRGQERFADTPIIMFTAKSMADEKWEGFQAGATDYLVKPTNTEELTKRVRAVLNRSSKVLKRNPDEPGGTSGLKAPQLEKNFRPQIVAFIGSRGGVGTTTAAVNAAYVTSRLYPTLLVDLDMVQGHIAQYLNLPVQGGLNELIAGSVLSMRAQLPNETVALDDKLDLLLARPNITYTEVVAKGDQMPHLADALFKSGRQVIVDAGLGVKPVNRPLLERVDQIVLCFQAERVSVAAAKSILVFLDEIVMPTTTVHPLMISIGSVPKVAEAAIEKFIGQKLLTHIIIESAQMAQAVNRGQPVVKAVAEGDVARRFALVAKTMIAAG